MARKAPKTQMTEYKIPDAGWQLGLCDRIVIMGPQETNWGVKEKIWFRWSLPEHLLDDGRPMSVSKMYTFSMFEKANLCRDIQDWTDHEFADQQEADEFDVETLLGKQANLKIKHKKGDTRTYANVHTVDTCTPKEVPDYDDPPFLYDVNDPATWGHYEKLPNWIKDKIPAPGGQKAVAKQGDGFEDDSIPF